MHEIKYHVCDLKKWYFFFQQNRMDYRLKIHLIYYMFFQSIFFADIKDPVCQGYFLINVAYQDVLVGHCSRVWSSNNIIIQRG